MWNVKWHSIFSVVHDHTANRMQLRKPSRNQYVSEGTFCRRFSIRICGRDGCHQDASITFPGRNRFWFTHRSIHFFRCPHVARRSVVISRIRSRRVFRCGSQFNGIVAMDGEKHLQAYEHDWCQPIEACVAWAKFVEPLRIVHHIQERTLVRAQCHITYYHQSLATHPSQKLIECITAYIRRTHKCMAT